MRGKAVGKPRKGTKRDRRIRNFAEKEQSMGANPVGGAVASRTKFGNGARLRVREKDIGDGGRGEYETLEEAAGRSVRVKESIEPNAGTGAGVQKEV